jgi:hypothetical protein
MFAEDRDDWALVVAQKNSFLGGSLLCLGSASLKHRDVDAVSHRTIRPWWRKDKSKRDEG